MKSLIIKNKSFLISYLIFILLGGLVLLLYDKISIFLFINSYNHPVADVFFKYFTHIGDGVFYLFVIALLIFVKYRYALIGFSSYLLCSLIIQVLKRGVFLNEFRPSKFFQDYAFPIHYVDGVTLHSYNSFPSGHAATAFSMFCFLSLISKRKDLGYLFFIFAFFVSFSRIYIAQHFLADIYLGSIIAVISTVVVFYIFELKFNKYPWMEKSALKK